MINPGILPHNHHSTIIALARWRWMAPLLKLFLSPLTFSLLTVSALSDPNATVAAQTAAHPINATIYSTNPRISYHPESQCVGGVLGSCGERYDPWSPEAYTTSEGIVETFFATSNWQNQPDTDQIRRVTFGFRGSAIYMYGAPFAHLKHPPGLHEVCLGATCTPVDTTAIYDGLNGQIEEPVLLWYQDGLDASRYHEVHLRLQQPDSPDAFFGMTFHHLIVTEDSPAEREPWKLEEDQQFTETTLYDTNPLLSYSPVDMSTNWAQKIFSADGLHNQSFHYATSSGNQPEGDATRAITWQFKGARLSVYGAPKGHLLHNPGHVEICVWMKCHPIDMARIYNNVWSIHERVLLYSNDRFDPTQSTTATIRFLQKDSPISGVVKGFAFLQAVVTEVETRTAVESGTMLIKHTIPDDYPDMRYWPPRSWDVESYPTVYGSSRTFHHTSTRINEITGQSNRRMTFTVPGRTASCEIYGAPRSRLIHPHGRQEVCISQRNNPDDCRVIDIEQAYLNVDPDVIQDPVLIYTLGNLDVQFSSRITVRLVDRTEFYDQNVRGMTISDLVCWEYVGRDGPYWRWDPGHGSPRGMTSTVKNTPMREPTAPGPTIPQGTPVPTKTGPHPHHSPTHQPKQGPLPLYVPWMALLSPLCVLLLVGLRYQWIHGIWDPERAPILHANPLSIPVVESMTYSEIKDLPISVLSSTVRSLTGLSYTIPPTKLRIVLAFQRWAVRRMLIKQLWEWKCCFEKNQRQDRNNDCVVCYDRPATMLLLHCGHLCLCQNCSSQIMQQGQPCPMCRAQVVSAIPTFRP